MLSQASGRVSIRAQTGKTHANIAVSMEHASARSAPEIQTTLSDALPSSSAVGLVCLFVANEMLRNTQE